MDRIDEGYHNGVLPLMGRIDNRVSYWSVLLPMDRIDEGYHNGVLPLMGMIDDRVS